MVDTLQHGSISGNASVRQRVSGEITIGGKIMKELRFLPYSEFPEIGREETLYIDTDNNAMYYYDGSAYVALSGGGGGGTDNYNMLSNKPSVNSVTLIGDKTSSELGLQELISDLSTIRSGAASGSTAVQPETLETALSEKQDVINDLDDIRSGASAGATAVQPSDMESALSGKQDVISDLSDIRSGASAGATAVQPSDMETALSGKQDTISDLQTIRSGAALGTTAVQPSDMETALTDKQDVISDLDAIRSGATAGNTALQPEEIDTLPTDGSSNPVSSGGTYNFVNSSIATNTAYFIGTFASVAELEAYSGTVTNNDYAFVTSTDSAGNTLYNRYKYNAATLVWSFEYAVNNTAFTTAQWAAIQSGMTSADKTKLDGIEQGANKTVIDTAPTSGSSNAVSSGGVHTALSGKQDTIADLSDIRSGASAGATAVQPSELTDDQQRQEMEIGVVANAGAKNLFQNKKNAGATVVKQGATWVFDQTSMEAVVSGTVGSIWSDLYLLESNLDLSDKEYKIVIETDSSNLFMYIPGNTLSGGNIPANGQYYAGVYKYKGVMTTTTRFTAKMATYSGNSIRCMVCPASITDSTFIPYAKTNRELTVAEDEDRSALIEQVDSGAKNLLDFEKWANAVGVVRGTKTVQDDAITITATGASCNTYWASADFPADSRIPVAPGDKVVLSWKTDNTSGTEKGTVYIFGNGNASYLTYTSDISEILEYTIPSGVSYITWRVGVNAAGDSIKYSKLMLCSATDYAISKAYASYALSNPVITPALIKQVDEGAKNLLNLNTDFTTCTTKGITYENNSDGTIKVSGTSTAGDSYINLYDRNTDNLFGIQKGETVVLRSTSDNVSVNLIYKKSGGGYSLTVYGYKNSPAWFTVPSDFAGFLLRIGVLRNGTTVNEDVGGMICAAADYAVSPEVVPYALSNPVLTPALIEQVDSGAKNLCNVADFPTTTAAWRQTILGDGVTLPAGEYILSFTNITSDADGTLMQIIFAKDISFTETTSDYFHITKGTNTSIKIRLTGDTGVIRIYAGSSYAGSQGKSLSFSGFMICTAADWAVSKKFVPYCPTNRELYETCETKVTMQQAYGDAIPIPAGSNLNNYNTPGLYYVLVANVSTITNTPYTATGFRLVVEKNTLSGAAVFQTIYPASRAYLEFYRRVYEGGSWSSWYKFEGTAVT